MLKFVAKALRSRKARKAETAVEVTPPAKEEEREDDFVSLADLEDAVISSKGADADKGAADDGPIDQRPKQKVPALERPAAGRPSMGSRTANPERQELLRQALRVQRAKQEVFRDLSQEERERLYVVAMKTLVDKDFGEKAGKKKK